MSATINDNVWMKSAGLRCVRRQRLWLTIGAILVLNVALLLGLWGHVSAAPAVPPSVAITSVNAPSAAPGGEVQYTIAVRVRNQAAESGVITFTMASQLDVTAASVHAFAVPSWTPGSNVVTWTVSPSFPVSTVSFTVTAQVPATGNILGDPLPYVADAYLCNLDGCGLATRSGANTIVGPGILKQNTTSIIITDPPLSNGEHQAVAGETATIVVQFVIPDGTVAYTVTPRIVLQDGLVPVSSNPAWTRVITGAAATLDTRTNVDGYQLEYAVSSEITESTTLEYTIQAVRMQNTDPDIKPAVEIVNGARLKIQPVLRWCNAPGCVISEASNATYSAVDTTDNTTVSVVAINPLVNTTIAHAFASGIGGGGGQVRFTYTHAGGGTSSAPRPTAYNAIFTATLGVSLTLDTTEPMYDGTFILSDTTVLTWAVPVDLAYGTSWSPVVTATLPSQVVAGQSFTTTSRISYDTYSGDFSNEGVYETDASYAFTAGVSNIKTSVPAADSQVTMGDVVTYHVRLEVGPNVSLPVFHYTDTLPLGFQLLTPVTVEGDGGTLLGYQTAAGPAVSGMIKTALGWSLDALPPSPSGYVITSTYTVVNSGLDYEGLPVYVTASDLTAIKSDKNSVTMYWGDGNFDGPREAAIRVIQPSLNNANFDIVRTDSGARDVNFPADYRITFRNSGRSPAYDLQICDTLPEGVMFLQNKNTPANLISSPSPGAAGTICWQFSELANGVTSQIDYAVMVTDGALPGTGLDDYAEVVSFSSKPGAVPYERSYADIEAALSDEWCEDCLWVLGFEADKSVQQPNTYPGEYITYTIVYSNSSALYTYDNAVITDTYDANLIFVSADPAGEHNPGARQLQWDLGTLALADYGEIVVTMRVQDVITDGATSVVNTLLWDSDNSRPHQRQTVTPLWVAEVGMDLNGPAHTHAGETILYTVTYSNTGTAAAPVTITLDYGPYVDYVSAVPAPVQGNNVFTDTVPNDGVEKTIQVTLQVKAPLPYQLTQFGATAELQTPGLLNITDAWVVTLDRPVITLDKVAPIRAAPVTPPNNIMGYTIHLRNNGTYTATGVVLTDTWGINTDYHSNNHVYYGWTEPAPGVGYVTRTFDLGINQSVTFDFSVAVTETASFYTNTVVMTTDQTTLQNDTAYAWSASIATSKSAMPIPAFPGRVLTYTIYYTNTTPPPGALTGVRITDTLPLDFTYQGQTVPDGASCPGGWSFIPPVGSGGGEAVWTCESLFPDQSGHFLIWGLVATSAEGGDLENVTASSATGVALRPIEEPLVTHVARPWLRVDKAVAPTHPVAPGDRLTYTLTYENYGTDPAYDVIMTDPLPAEVDYVSCSGAESCGESSDVVTWTIATLPVDTVGTVQLVVRVKTGASGQVVNENYTIQSERLPVNETSNGAAVASPVLTPGLALHKVATPPVVTEQNQPITYTIYYTNSGGGLLSQVVLTDVLSSLTYFQDASEGCAWEGIGTGGTVTCDLGNLTQGKTGHVQIVVLNIATEQGQEIINTAAGDADEIAPVNSNQTSVFYYGSGCIPPWNPAFTYSPAQPVAGAVVTFQGTVEAGDPPFTYTWTFGDTGVGAGQAVTHVYAMSDTYTVMMTVDNPCHEPQTATRQVSVIGESHITVSPDALAETEEVGYSAFVRTITITTTGTSDLTWTAVVTPASEVWLSLAPAGGTVAPGGDAELAVTFEAGLDPNVYTADILITSNAVNAPVLEVPVTFTVTEQSGAPEVAWTPSAGGFTKTADEGSTASLTDTLTVSNQGDANLYWSLVVTPTSATWLKVAVGGELPGTSLLPQTTTPGMSTDVTVYFDPTGLPAGTYTAQLRIESNDADEGVVLIPVTFTIRAPDEDYYIYLPLVVRNYQ